MLGTGGVIISEAKSELRCLRNRLTSAVSGVSTAGSWIGSRRCGTSEVGDGAASFVVFVGIDTGLLEVLAAPNDIESLPIITAEF